MPNHPPNQRVSELSSGHEREVLQRAWAPADWMANLDWLREREEKILARINEEGSPAGRVPTRPIDRRARREALMVIRRRIAELEAEETWCGSRTAVSDPL